MPKSNQADANPKERTPWHALDPKEVQERLEVGSEGLDRDEVRRRLERFGPNKLKEERRRPAWRRFLDQFNNVLMIILAVAGVVSLFLGKPIDAGAIFGVIVIIAAIGFVQEGKAESALESIKGMLSPKARVVRGGRVAVVPAVELVPGDVVE
ncbi:MAG: cation-transporting P-type ATPase, partial [Puniceicoccaceae bacterium]